MHSEDSEQILPVSGGRMRKARDQEITGKGIKSTFITSGRLTWKDLGLHILQMNFRWYVIYSTKCHYIALLHFSPVCFCSRSCIPRSESMYNRTALYGFLLPLPRAQTLQQYACFLKAFPLSLRTDSYAGFSWTTFLNTRLVPTSGKASPLPVELFAFSLPCHFSSWICYHSLIKYVSVFLGVHV